MEHVSHYIHMMSLHTHNDALMCKVFPLSLGLTTLRWFNGLRKGSIRSFAELIQEFGAWFVTCSQVPQLVDALLSIKMGGTPLGKIKTCIVLTTRIKDIQPSNAEC